MTDAAPVEKPWRPGEPPAGAPAPQQEQHHVERASFQVKVRGFSGAKAR